MLEEAKAREVNLLKDEQDHLREQIRNLTNQNKKIAESKHEVKDDERMSKKVSMRERLASIEAASQTASPQHSSDIVNDKSDIMSHVQHQ